MSTPSQPSLLYPLAAFPCTIIPVFLLNKANKDHPSKPFYLFLVVVATLSSLYAARGSYLAFYDAAFLPSTASPLYRKLSSGGYAAQALGMGMVAVVGWQVWWAGVKERRAGGANLKEEGLTKEMEVKEGEKVMKVGEESA